MKLALLALLCALGTLAEAAEVVVSNVIYARTRNGEPIFLDWYVPDGASGALCAIVHVHGGGWYQGDKVTTSFPTFLRDGDCILASINYRLATVNLVAGNNTSYGKWPTQIQDVRAAIRFVRQQAGTNIAGTSATVDPERIGLIGASAGGHLVTYAALTADDRALDNPPLTLAQDESVSCAVKAVVGVVPVTDLRDPIGAMATYESYLLGAVVATVPDLAAAASPILHVRTGAPPTFILNRASDEVIATSQATEFINALAARGVTTTLRTEPGTHGTALSAGDQTAILAFLGAHL